VPRACVIVLDAVGAGDLPDAADFGTAGSSTIAHVAEAVGGLEVPAMQGLGVGSRLVKAVLDDARAHGRPIVPACAFVKSYLERHPEYADVVAGRV